MLLKKFLLILFTIQISKQKCTEGCLKCSTTEECLICDTLQNFKLNGTKCEKTSIENCLISNLAGDCLSCKIDFYLDNVSQKCVKIDELRKIENCLNYDTKQNCISCVGEFVVKNTVCSAIIKSIENCEVYNTDETCNTCKPNFIKSLDGTCKGSDGCLYYGEVQCEICKPGFIRNNNIFFDSLFNFESVASKDFLVYTVNSFVEKKQAIKIYDVCQIESIWNCVEYKNHEECQICAEGNYLTSTFSCAPYPFPIISHCIQYSNSSLCTECDNNFYLKNNSCLDVDKIDNCEVYNGKTSITQCTLCSKDYYLTSNSCLLREKSIGEEISNCKTLDFHTDTCAECINGYVLSSERHKCFEEVGNCLQYVQLFENSTKAVCSKCKLGYYLKEDKSCGEGQKENCLKFSAVDKCEECIDQYYFDENKSCKKSENIVNCSIYSKNEADTCIKCQGDTFNFKFNSVCKTFGAIPNCEVYSNLDPITCLECQSTYFLEEGICKKLSAENCAVGETLNLCSKCLPTFALHEKKCIDPFHFTSFNCKKTSVDLGENSIDIKDVVCNNCEINSIHYNFKNLFICVKDEFLSLFGVQNPKDNCIKYNGDLCVQCGNNKFLKGGNCLDNCAETDSIHRVKFSGIDPDFKIENFNVCEVRKIDRCGIEAVDYSNFGLDDANLICVKCLDSALTTIDFSNQYSNIDINAQSAPFITSEVQVSPKVNCIDGADYTTIENCEYYSEFGGANKGCIRCKNGFTGIISAAGNIQSCINLITAETNPCEDRFYQNLNPLWQKLFSCHKCSTSGQIPVLLMRFTAVNNITPQKYVTYDLSSESDWVGSNDKTVICLRNELASFFHQNNSASLYRLSQNCALAVVNLSDTGTAKQPVDDYYPLFCAACKPKYSPVVQGVGTSHLTTPYIVTCEEIQNCIGSEWFNSCSKCNANYVYSYKKDSKTIEYNKCIEHTKVKNCYAAEEGQNGQPSECKLCKKGFNMNKDLFCESFKPSGCSSSDKFNVDQGLNKTLVRYFSYFDQSGLGCSECISTMKAVYYETDLFSCTLSTYIEENLESFDNDNSAYIVNCISYYSLPNGTMKCSICKEGFIVDIGNNKCSKGLLNCLTASNTDGQCALCKDGFALINNLCEKGSIQNCDEFNSDTNETNQICNKCKEGYFKDTQNTCNEGFISNCDQYIFNSAKQCLSCKKHFTLIHMNLSDYCYPVNEGTECLEAIVDSSDVYGATFECIKCKLTNQITSSRPEYIPLKTMCMDYNIIENCQTYDVNKVLNSSTFKCTKCTEEYFLDTEKNLCLERKLSISNCKEYAYNEDFCSVCEENHYINDSKTKCISFPNGIIGCRLFKDTTTCIGCEKNMFLKNDVCTKILEDFLITNCVYYEEETKCGECDANYVLIDGKCSLVKAKECVTYAGVYKCATCKDSYGLSVEKDGKIDCIKVIKTNCIAFDKNDPYPCLKCKKGYYILEGDCKNVSEQIPDCEEYEDATSCKRCSSVTALSINKTECIKTGGYENQIQTNCHESVIKNELFCSVCQPGNYFNGTECQPCQAGIEMGCFSCDYKKPEICLICNSGYYMTKEGTCVNYAAPVTAPVVEEEGFDIKVVFVTLFLILL